MLPLLVLLPVFVFSANIRSRPRGLGLLRLPAGSTDEKSAPMFPNLYIAGNKAGTRPQPVSDIHLPGQTGRFSGKTQFNPFTQQFAASYDDHNRDDWGFGYAVSNVNLLGLEVRKNFDLYKNMPDHRDDGSHQPFIHAFLVGADWDPSRYTEFADIAVSPLTRE
ncbi:hypothetical protein L596_006929 [Steinernema carpocapsae]|uniref:Uncharacterized protein n=1 Tax=Steinernema carpocapsae TaxID=34508 RepID=A0A4U5P7L5_STECR|nr:hypothetical protein L596_006929 [Steinernema carpocapsae]